MALANTTAADVLKNQGVRDKAIPVVNSFQRLSQSNTRLNKTLAQVQTDVTALIAALQNAGATTTAGATQVTLTSGVKVNAVSVTGTGNFATFTIANGAITAIVLSAS